MEAVGKTESCRRLISLAGRQIHDGVAENAVQRCGDAVEPAIENVAKLSELRILASGEDGDARQQRCERHSGRPNHPVIRTATAVMSSFGGVSPRHSATAAKIASTTFAGGRSLTALHDLEEACRRELLAEGVHRLEDAVRAEHEQVARRPAGTSARRRWIPGRSRAERRAARSACSVSPEQRIGYGSPEFASVIVRRFKSNTA